MSHRQEVHTDYQGRLPRIAHSQAPHRAAPLVYNTLSSLAATAQRIKIQATLQQARPCARSPAAPVWQACCLNCREAAAPPRRDVTMPPPQSSALHTSNITSFLVAPYRGAAARGADRARASACRAVQGPCTERAQGDSPVCAAPARCHGAAPPPAAPPGAATSPLLRPATSLLLRVESGSAAGEGTWLRWYSPCTVPAGQSHLGASLRVRHA